MKFKLTAYLFITVMMYNKSDYVLILTLKCKQKLEPVFIRNVCGFSSIILLQTRQKSAGVLPHGKDF